MKTLKKIAALVVIMIIAITACKKEPLLDQPENPDDGNKIIFSSVKEYLDKNKKDFQTFQIDAQNGGVINTSGGCNITIPANAFVDQNGNTIIGNVSINFKDVLKKSDMIFQGIFPKSGDSILNSGGQFFISAEQNNLNLEIADGVFLNIEIPAQAIDSSMQLFFGGQDKNPDTLDWGNPVPKDTVVMAPGGTVNPVQTVNSSFTFSSSDNTYQIKMNKLGWGNIDAFMQINYFNCSFNHTGVQGLDNTNTKAYAVFKDKNTVWPVGGTDGWSSYGNISGNLINDSHLGAIPTNILVISVKEGVLYSGVLEITPQANQTASIQLKETTASELDALIGSLP